MKHPERDDPTTPEPVETPGEAAADQTPEQPETAPADPAALLEAELADTKDRLLRALAEVENLRRRSARELDEARKYAVSGFARELLEVDDNLSRALANLPTDAGEVSGLVKTLGEGVALTQKALAACFERHRIAKVTPQIGERFDHNRHQAMFEVEADQPAGTIAQVLQPGYVIADRLLRPALVGVAKAPAQAAGPEGSDPRARIDRTA
jgi:molecular chaperone GrpE